MWNWRVELDKRTGDILRFAKCEPGFTSTTYIRYVEASTAPEACSLAKQWYERHCGMQNARSKRVRDRRRESGLCIYCGHSPRPGAVACQACTDRNAAHTQAARRRGHAGETIDLRRTLGAEGARAKLRERNAARRRAHPEKNLNLLAHVALRALRDLSPGEAPAYEAWLVARIERARSKNHGVEEALAQAAE